MKQKLPLAALLIAPYVLLAGGIALLLHGKPWMILVLWALIVLLAFLPAMVCAFLLPRRGWPARRASFRPRKGSMPRPPSKDQIPRAPAAARARRSGKPPRPPSSARSSCAVRLRAHPDPRRTRRGTGPAEASRPGSSTCARPRDHPRGTSPAGSRPRRRGCRARCNHSTRRPPRYARCG